MSKYKSWLLPGAIVVAVSIWLISGEPAEDENSDARSESEISAAADSKAAVRVRTQSAEKILRTITVNGKTAPARTVELTAETDGRIIATVAERGTNTELGDVIVRLDERDRSARLVEAKATVKQREVEYQGRLQLKSERYVSEAQLQEAVAQLEGARTEMTRAQLDLSYMNIRAPFAGAVQSRAVEIGDFVKRGDAVATYVDNRVIIVSANLSEFDARFVNVGDPGEAELATGETVHGRIRYVAPVADEATRTFGVELEIDNSDGALRIGGTAKMRIPAEQILAHHISPSLLTLNDAGNIGIKLINDDGLVEFVVADIALSSSHGIWIAGLPEVATIITVGQGYVTDGTRVNAIREQDVKASAATDSAGKASN